MSNYYAILGHSGTSLNSEFKQVPNKTNLIFTTSCGRLFGRNSSYVSVFKDTSKITDFLIRYSLYLSNPNRVTDYEKRIFQNIFIQKGKTNNNNNNKQGNYYPNTPISIGPPNLNEMGRLKLLHGVYRLPENIFNKNATSKSIIPISSNNQNIKLSNILNKIKENQAKRGSNKKAKVFGLFCRGLPGLKKYPSRLRPSEVNGKNVQTRKLGSIRRFRSLRKTKTRQPYFETINNSKSFINRVKSLTSRGPRGLSFRAPVFKPKRVR